MAGIDAETLKRLLDEHAAALALYARQWCDTPDDVVQDAFMLLLREPSPPENFVGWLFTVVRNKAINAAQSGRRRARREALAVQGRDAWLIAPTGEQIDAAEAARALADLPLEQREAIIARIWGGLSLAETAKLLGTSLSTAFRRYQHGIATLRGKMEKVSSKTSQKGNDDE